MMTETSNLNDVFLMNPFEIIISISFLLIIFIIFTELFRLYIIRGFDLRKATNKVYLLGDTDNLPVYQVNTFFNGQIILSGGGGKSKTGVPNFIDYRLFSTKLSEQIYEKDDTIDGGDRAVIEKVGQIGLHSRLRFLMDDSIMLAKVIVRANRDSLDLYYFGICGTQLIVLRGECLSDFTFDELAQVIAYDVMPMKIQKKLKKFDKVMKSGDIDSYIKLGTPPSFEVTALCIDAKNRVIIIADQLGNIHILSMRFYDDDEDYPLMLKVIQLLDMKHSIVQIEKNDIDGTYFIVQDGHLKKTSFDNDNDVVDCPMKEIDMKVFKWRKLSRWIAPHFIEENEKPSDELNRKIRNANRNDGDWRCLRMRQINEFSPKSYLFGGLVGRRIRSSKDYREFLFFTNDGIKFHKLEINSKRHDRSATELQLHHNYAVIGFSDGNIDVWDLTRREIISTENTHQSMITAITPFKNNENWCDIEISNTCEWQQFAPKNEEDEPFLFISVDQSQQLYLTSVKSSRPGRFYYYLISFLFFIFLFLVFNVPEGWNSFSLTTWTQSNSLLKLYLSYEEQYRTMLMKELFSNHIVKHLFQPVTIQPTFLGRNYGNEIEMELFGIGMKYASTLYRDMVYINGLWYSLQAQESL
ncbi:hypothetical protein SNEBB_006250 [Seison nebaliae]|nr:hypothetical protein SNEBB_006250 [Seison nebaliae]